MGGAAERRQVKSSLAGAFVASARFSTAWYILFKWTFVRKCARGRVAGASFRDQGAAQRQRMHDAVICARYGVPSGVPIHDIKLGSGS